MNRVDPNCPICGVSIFLDGAIPGMVIDCHGCGTELEVIQSDTGLELTEAPPVEEDWGE